MNKEFYLLIGNEKWYLTHDVKETEELKLTINDGEDKFYTIITGKELKDFILQRQSL